MHDLGGAVGSPKLFCHINNEVVRDVSMVLFIPITGVAAVSNDLEVMDDV